MWVNVVYCGEDELKEAKQFPATIAEEKTNPRKPRILIIEDEFLVAWELESILQDLNLEVCGIASDAETGVDYAVNLDAELLVVDVNLGDGPDGIEAVRRIQNHRQVAVIFITAYTDQFNLSRIQAVAPHALVLSKPVSRTLLPSTIKKLLRHI